MMTTALTAGSPVSTGVAPATTALPGTRPIPLRSVTAPAPGIESPQRASGVPV